MHANVSDCQTSMVGFYAITFRSCYAISRLFGNRFDQSKALSQLKAALSSYLVTAHLHGKQRFVVSIETSTNAIRATQEQSQMRVTSQSYSLRSTEAN